MQKTLRTDKYRSMQFESSPGKTPQWIAFSKAMKRDLASILPAGFELASYSSGHFYFSAFVRRIATADNFGKPSFYHAFCSDVRFSSGQWHKALTVRTAKSLTDYTGGQNNTTSLEGLAGWLARQ